KDPINSGLKKRSQRLLKLSKAIRVTSCCATSFRAIRASVKAGGGVEKKAEKRRGIKEHFCNL
ncbi:hypothetical protein GIB67_013200, partial [Kingdonia uniflora]